MISRPELRTPTSGVLMEVLYVCAVALSGGLSAWAIRRAATSAPPTTPAPKPVAPEKDA